MIMFDKNKELNWIINTWHFKNDYNKPSRHSAYTFETYNRIYNTKVRPRDDRSGGCGGSWRRVSMETEAGQDAGTPDNSCSAHRKVPLSASKIPQTGSKSKNTHPECTFARRHAIVGRKMAFRGSSFDVRKAVRPCQPRGAEKIAKTFRDLRTYLCSRDTPLWPIV
jgi:hypothetical protein